MFQNLTRLHHKVPIKLDSQIPTKIIYAVYSNALTYSFVK